MKPSRRASRKRGGGGHRRKSRFMPKRDRWVSPTHNKQRRRADYLETLDQMETL